MPAFAFENDNHFKYGMREVWASGGRPIENVTYRRVGPCGCKKRAENLMDGCEIVLDE